VKACASIASPSQPIASTKHTAAADEPLPRRRREVPPGRRRRGHFGQARGAVFERRPVRHEAMEIAAVARLGWLAGEIRDREKARDKDMGVQEKPPSVAFPIPQFFLSHLVKIGCDPDLPFHAVGHTRFTPFDDRNPANERLSIAGDNHLFTGQRPLDKARERGLLLVNVDDFAHRLAPAPSTRGVDAWGAAA
jgi:hypothetical protein